MIAWFDEKAQRPRVTVGYVGEGGILADTWYAATEVGELIVDEELNNKETECSA